MKELKLETYFLYVMAERFIGGAGNRISSLQHDLSMYDPKDKSKETKKNKLIINKDIGVEKKLLKKYRNVYDKLDKQIKIDFFNFKETDFNEK